MGTPFLGEIKIASFNFAPQGWALANGQQLPINQNQALFSLFGTMYGGNGQTTFALPDLRGRVPIHRGTGFTQGQNGGETAHTLTQPEMPAHVHVHNSTSDNATTGTPTGNLIARSTNFFYEAPANLTTLNPAAITNTGGSQPHQNMQPFLALTFMVALIGVFPSRN